MPETISRQKQSQPYPHNAYHSNMRIDQNFKIRKVAGETIIVNQGHSHTDLTKIISFNTTSEALWNNFYEKDFDEAAVSQFLIDTYGITNEQATQDSTYWIEKLKECKLIID